jgi:hypothetical protein
VGATSTATTNVVIPSSASLGTRYVCAFADDLAQVAESNESNNTQANPISIVRPDLRMSSLLTPASATPGDAITINNTVVNSGTGSAGGFRVGLYLSADATCTTGDTFLTSRVVAGLASGAASAAATAATIPPGASGGAQYVCAIADYLGQVVESNETNNTASNAIDIVLVATVNLEVNGLDVEYPGILNTSSPIRLTIDMTAGPIPLDHYFAIIVGGTAYWLTPTGELSLTPVPLSTFTPVVLNDIELLDIPVSPGVWGFAWLMLDGGTLVDYDIILANVVP